jgi:hypothetical protein
MKAWLILLAGVAVAGCGGSVDSDPNGSGGSGGSSGAGAAGGIGGSGAFGGSGAVSGSSGTAGSGAVAGTAGSGSTGGAPACCSHDLDCPQYFDDDRDDPGAPLTTQCIEGVCKPIPNDGSCWDQDDCPYGACQGASVCPCEWDCIVEDTPGWCALPPEPYCCQTDFDCGDFMYVPCVANVCKQPVPGACWKDEECGAGTKCVGANVCPCGAYCAIADTPGKCI